MMRMVNWGMFERRNKLHGSSSLERKINDAREEFNREYKLHPAYHDCLVGNRKIGALLYNTVDMDIMTFDAPFGSEIVLGDLVVVDGLHWLVTEMRFPDKITVHGKIEQCNRQIAWQNPKTGEIIRRWCTADKPYYRNLEFTREVTVSNREFKIQVQFDEETSLIDIDKRFMFEVIDGKPKVYKVTSVDVLTTTYEELDRGFITWNVTQDLYDEDVDNVELGICDYKPSTSPLPPPPHHLAAQVLGNDTMRSGGPAAEYVVDYDKSKIVGTVVPHWRVVDDGGIDSLKLADEGEKCTVSVQYAALEDAGKAFTIEFSDENGLVATCTKTVRVVGWY